ncbi:arginine deiminase [Peptoniphilus stercorisuis]|uniref:Arginine deiminase n=1 Tax=Peptoniphilus stercorisuis TaxID=1436965 RepID=A0ABS4KCL0_9FIRM|nr:arginine deiminase [Peptoniphilus stercorisuis]MBP2025513.1 arginine deiminase [Peptoniphilus stercorisuis]
MSVINVTSEIKPLKKVLLHRPGKELLNLTPETLEELLFDDIPFLKVAQEEHDAFAKILKDNGVEVVYLEDLMAETLKANEGLREQFLKQFIKEAGIKTERYQKMIFDFFNAIKDDKELVLKTMEGVNINELKIEKSNSLVDYMNDSNSMMILNPMPNLYFTRDPFASVGDGVVLNRMYSVTRNRETIYADYIFKYHPEYKGKVELLYNRDLPFHIEGGDVLNINDKVLAIGISQRTEAAAIDQLARNIFFESNSKVEEILAFDIPVTRAFMHLDTVFTQIDTDKFTIHPAILGTLRVFKLTKENDDVKVVEMHDTLEHVLAEALGHPVDLILCGDGDAIVAAREQWNDGSNTLCISPGTIVVYERNDVTNEVLRKKGLNLIEMPSAELSRGRGGPRCMSMPLVRED